ncbi:nitrilase-related carbon-nitrogen hydrolase [Bacillus canaveralius]|nr:nitrilase-related carbon-nitrogen hydrolase [Bacillus canaveralius]
MRVASIQVEANDLKDYFTASEKLERLIEKAAQDHDLILVPECAYPSYFIAQEEGDLCTVIEKGHKYLHQIKEIAKRDKTYIAYGYVEKEEEHLFNSAVLIDREGKEIAKKRKSFLWHFDSTWFAEGNEIAIADTDFGRVGLVICADARMPETVRMAALEGAELIIDLANLTASGPDISLLHNAQSAYMLSVRALENNVWLAVSDKWGVEADTITYAGRSSVYAPDGECLYQAGSNKDEIVSVEVPTDENGRIKKVPAPYRTDRRPECYKTLTAPLDSLPTAQLANEPVESYRLTPYTMVSSGHFERDYVQMIRRMIAHGANLIVLAPNQISFEDYVDEIQQLLPSSTYLVATTIDNGGRMVSYIVTKAGIQHVYETVHTEGKMDPVEPSSLIYGTEWGRIAIMHDTEALLPEWPRTLTLQGADCIIWPNQLPAGTAGKVARTRAAENRICVISAQSSDGHNAISQLIDPNGSILASTLIGKEKHACGSFVPFVLSRFKNVVPGTNVVTNRHPQFYGRLTK